VNLCWDAPGWGDRCGWSGAGDAINLVRARAARSACSVTRQHQRSSVMAVPVLEVFFAERLLPQASVDRMK
jgi:hypothetical protein